MQLLAVCVHKSCFSNSTVSQDDSITEIIQWASATKCTYLAFKGFDIRVNNHVGLESLLLHKTLEAQVALIGSDVGVDQDMSLHVGQQSKFPATNSTFVLFHPL